MLKVFVTLIFCFSFGFCQNDSNYDLRRYNNKFLNYTVLMCKEILTPLEAGKAFKLFVEREQWNTPCMIQIPSRVFVYLLIKFHKPSVVTVVSGNGKKSHTGQTIIPKLHEATLYGPVYVPCKKAVIVFRSRGFDESVVFSFSFPSRDFIASHPDPLSCDERFQNPPLRRAIGYAGTPWIVENEKNIHVMRDNLRERWLEHRKTAFDPLS